MKIRIPIFVTLLVVAAATLMVGLGIWQLQRADWKNGLLATYEAAADKPKITYPLVPTNSNPPYFRRSSVNCVAVTGWRSVSGRNVKDEAGWAHIAQCRTSAAEGPGAQVTAGWSKSPENPQWQGGIVQGIIAPDSRHVIRLVAFEPVAGLERSQAPSVEDIPNNHFGYAIQWFIFAGLALLIYFIALRGRNNGAAQPNDLP